MTVEYLQSPNGPRALGPYSPAVRAGDWVIVSGQVPLDPETGQIIGGGIQEQTHQVMANLRAVLEDQGLGLNDLAKTTVFVTDLGEFGLINEVYAHHMGACKPARATVEVSALPLGARIEVEGWAFKPTQ